MTAIVPTPDEMEAIVTRLVANRREGCYCAAYRKPCTTCDAYWDGAVDMGDALLNGRSTDA